MEEQKNKYSMWSMFQNMLIFSKKYWILGTIIFVLMGITIFFNLGVAYVNEQALNFIDLNNRSEFNRLILITFIIGIVCIFLLFIQDYLKKYVPSLITRDLALKLYHKLHSLPLVKLFPLHTGDLATRVKNDSQKSVEIMGNSTYSLVFNILMALSAFTYLSTISWPLALLIVCSGPITLIVGRTFDKSLRKLSAVQENKNAEVKSFLQEYFQGMSTVRAYELNTLMKNKYMNKRLELNSISLQRSVKNQLMWIIIGLSNKLMFMAIFLIVCILTFKGSLEIGALLAFFILMNRVQAPFMAISGTWGNIQEAFGASKRVYGILDIEDIDEQTEDLTDNSESKLLKLKNISFSFPATDSTEETQTISNISLSIKKGERIAIVGRSGSGKTTLAKIISGLYTPNKGRIAFYNDKDTVKKKGLINYISYVPQQTYVFSDTIFDNISYGNTSASREDVINAAKSAKIHDEILQLDESYETVIAEKGATLSGGQQQRLTIARAFLKDSPILILDEATSALDVRSEKLIYEAMEELMDNKTLIMIAHRMSTIKKMDRIIVLDEGQIVEEGEHEELMELKGAYFNLVQGQFSNSDSNGDL